MFCLETPSDSNEQADEQEMLQLLLRTRSDSNPLDEEEKKRLDLYQKRYPGQSKNILQNAHIEWHVLGQMSDQEKVDFEEEMNSNPELRKRRDLYFFSLYQTEFERGKMEPEEEAEFCAILAKDYPELRGVILNERRFADRLKPKKEEL